MPLCGCGCANTPRTIPDAGSGPPTTTPAPRDAPSITRRSNAFGVKKDCGSHNGEDANATAAPLHHRPSSPRHPTGCGPSTSSSTSPPTVARSRSSRSSTKHTRECPGGPGSAPVTRSGAVGRCADVRQPMRGLNLLLRRPPDASPRSWTALTSCRGSASCNVRKALVCRQFRSFYCRSGHIPNVRHSSP